MSSTPRRSGETKGGLASIRLISNDIDRLVGFYEALTGATARWLTDDFAEISTPSGSIAVSHPQRLDFLGEDAVSPGVNRGAVVEFLIDDVDATFEQLRSTLEASLGEVAQPPTTMPWGNRSLLLRDPDGTLVNLYAPVTPEAWELQAQRR